LGSGDKRYARSKAGRVVVSDTGNFRRSGRGILAGSDSAENGTSSSDSGADGARRNAIVRRQQVSADSEKRKRGSCVGSLCLQPFLCAPADRKKASVPGCA